VKRILLIAGSILVALAIGVMIFTVKKSPPTPAQGANDNSDPDVVEINSEARQNVELVTVEAAERPLRQMVKTTGVVSPNQSRVAHVFPLARGIVEKVYVQLGSKVRSGEPLLEYDNIELGQLIGEYLNLRGQLAKLQAQQQVSRKILDRAEALIKFEGVSRQELEVRRAEYQQAVAGVEGQQADVARVEEQLHRFGLTDDQIQRLRTDGHGTHRTASHSTLRAPINGIITKYDVSPGEVVDRGKEIFTVVDVSSVWVEADVYEKDIGLVRSGGEARITVASYPDRVFTGKITYVSDFLDPSSRTAKVRCVVRNPNGLLKLEMFAAIEIPEAETRRVLTVPTAALQQVGNETVVFVQQDAAHYRKRVVEPGDRIGDWVEIRQGLKPRERVVAEGGFCLKSLFLREQIRREE
jgi:membrane fusion protein, heavy metal efflux system